MSHSASISAIIPIRDAAGLLERCLAAVAAQTTPAEAVYIVVAPSADDSAGRAAMAAASDSRIRVLANPTGDRGSALNRALAEVTTEAVAMVDAQSHLAPDYFERALEVMRATGADVVGGPLRAVGASWIGEAMAMALASRFGVGDSQFHFDGAARRVDSVYLGVYRMSAFGRVGRYNRALLRTEDDDLNARIRESGGLIWLDPAIRSTYRCRDSFGAIWRQYEGYGYWKVALATLRPAALRPRHLVPAIFTLGLIGAAAASIACRRPALTLVVGPYAMISTAAAIGSRGSLRARLAMPMVTATMHLAYGVGTLWGLLRWPALRDAARSGRG